MNMHGANIRLVIEDAPGRHRAAVVQIASEAPLDDELLEAFRTVAEVRFGNVIHSCIVRLPTETRPDPQPEIENVHSN